MRPKNQNKSCPDAISNQCVSWQGGDVPCLDICNGMDLSEAEKIIADKICAIDSDLDMSTVDISCVLDSCNKKCEDKSLKAIVQLLFDNQCCIKDLIDNISGGGSEVSVNLNMRCLRVFDDFGNEIPQNLNQSLQSIINQVCTNKDDIAALKITVDSLQDQIDNIDTGGNNVEPNVTTCITPGLRPISQVVPLFAQDYCEYKGIVGSDADISGALSRQCPDLNPIYQTKPGWNLTVDNMAKTIANQWIVICDLLARINLIETNCCRITCDDIKVGFQVVPNESFDGVFINFTNAAGTSIPLGFEDCGSTVTITDIQGNSLKYDLVIENGAETGDFDVSGLDLSDFLTIEVTAKLCAEGINCDKCVTRLFKVNNNLCPFCEIVVTGSEGDSVTIIYEEF